MEPETPSAATDPRVEVAVSDHAFTLIRWFDAPRERVWRAWTDPRELATWWGPHGYTNPVVEADIRATTKRRQQGDAGVIAQRYVLTLYGNSQMLHLEPWQPETARTVTKPFAWKPDTWYRMKLQVENLADGKTRARGKVWLVGEAEPAEWMIERIDPIPNRQGAPGIFGNALAEIFFDNLKVYSNK